jgi:hypothetical protein
MGFIFVDHVNPVVALASASDTCSGRRAVTHTCPTLDGVGNVTWFVLLGNSRTSWRIGFLALSVFRKCRFTIWILHPSGTIAFLVAMVEPATVDASPFIYWNARMRKPT